MTVIELRDALAAIIDQGHGNEDAVHVSAIPGLNRYVAWPIDSVCYYPKRDADVSGPDSYVAIQ